MAEVFVKLLNMSITAGWLVLAVLILRKLFKKAPKTIICVLWAIVVVRLLCPVSFESVYSLIPTTEAVPESAAYINEPVMRSQLIVSNSEYTRNTVESPSFEINGDGARGIEAMEVVLIVWVIGTVAMLTYSFISYIRLKLKVREAVVLRENIWLCDHIDTPFIMGIIRPRIYIPSAMDEKQMEYVIAHEKVHLKRRDNVWKPFATVLLSVYWFNPLMWVAYVMFCRDIEFACDERVIGKMDEEDVRKYMKTLVSCSIPHHKLMAYPVAFGEIGVKSRIKTIVSYKKPKLVLSILAVVVCVVMSMFFLVDPMESKANEVNELLRGYEDREDDWEPIDPSILTEEQKAYLAEYELIDEEELKYFSYEEINWNLLGTGMELYNQSSGIEKFGLTYETTEKISEKSNSERLITYEELLAIRLKDKDMRLDDFMVYKYEIVENENNPETDVMRLPLDGYESMYVDIIFSWVDENHIKMKEPYIRHDKKGSSDSVFSVLGDQALFQIYCEMEPKYTMSGKPYINIRYGSVTENKLAVEVCNSTEIDLNWDKSYELYEMVNGEEKLVTSFDGKKINCRFLTMYTDYITLPDGIELKENTQYLLKYGKNKTGYIYGEIIFQR